ncbi:uncharacterized protein LOC123879756 isoform X2 [Maniola jurtina]|nr:uncharacterized protein LOC123879756 isoform X2 [Maniola jurtina]
MDTDEQQRVKECLASSENQFSAPATSSQQCTEETVKPAPQKHLITSEIQVHTINQKVKVPARQPIKLTIQQDDWDKIEEMPEIETNKSLENAVGPMDIETFNFLIDDEDYSANNPRRSSRIKELQSSKPPITNDVSSDKENGKNFNINSDSKIGQSWKNVKRMRKEFSKLNKKNKNKLNISIEMCKKAKLAVNKGALSNSQQVSYTIDENTPDIAAIGEVVTKNTDLKNLTASKVSFFRKGPLLNQTSLQTTYIDTSKTHVINVDNPNVKNKNTDRVGTGDIEIIIKIGNTLTNICIQKKENEVQYKTKTDREVQTSLGNSVVQNEDNVQS